MKGAAFGESVYTLPMLLLLHAALAAEPSLADEVDAGIVRVTTLAASATDMELACIQPKLSLLHGMRDLVGPVQRAWERALATGDTTHAEAEARKLAVIRSKLASFVAEAAACVEVEVTTTEVDGAPEVDAPEVEEDPMPCCTPN